MIYSLWATGSDYDNVLKQQILEIWDSRAFSHSTSRHLNSHHGLNRYFCLFCHHLLSALFAFKTAEKWRRVDTLLFNLVSRESVKFDSFFSSLAESKTVIHSRVSDVKWTRRQYIRIYVLLRKKKRRNFVALIKHTHLLRIWNTIWASESSLKELQM